MLALVVICLGFIWESRDLRSSGFEPLGPGALPIGLSVLVLILSVVVWRTAPPEPVKTQSDGKLWLPATLIALAILFTALLDFTSGGFALISFGFLVVTMTLLTGFNLRKLPMIFLIAGITAFGTEYIFTHILIVNLP